MKKLFFIIILLAANATFAQQKEWHVKPFAYPNNTTAGVGNGLSYATAWNLQTALNSTLVMPGDIIWLHGNNGSITTYKGHFTSSISGSSTNFIKVASYPGEWAVIDGNIYAAPTTPDPAVPTSGPGAGIMADEEVEYDEVASNKMEGYSDDDEELTPVLQIFGGFVQYENFEVTYLGNYSRYKNDAIPGNGFRGTTGIAHLPANTLKPTVKLVNLVVRNLPGVGIGSWKEAADSEIYGCIIYNNGYVWSRSSVVTNGRYRIFGKGPGIYTQNRSDLSRKIKNNLVLNNYDSGLFVWSASTAPGFDYVKNYDITENVFVNNGNPARAIYSDFFGGYVDSKPNVVIDSDSGNSFNHPTNIEVHDNIFYLNTLNFVAGIRADRGKNVNITNNYTFKGTKGMSFDGRNEDLTYTNNFYWGKFMQFSISPSSYLSQNWHVDHNEYYEWNYRAGYMYHVQLNYPTSAAESKIDFNTFKTTYPPAETSSTMTLIYGNNGLLTGGTFTNKTFIRQNEYNPNVFYVTVFNSRGNAVSSVNVDFSAYGIPATKSVRIKDAQNYATPASYQTFNGTSVTLNYTNTTPEDPTGYFSTPLFSRTRQKDFSVYVIDFGCPDVPYDLVKTGTNLNTNIYAARNNLTFGPGYGTGVNAVITAKAGKTIVLKPSTVFIAGSKLHAYIEDSCPDVIYRETTSGKTSLTSHGATPEKEAKTLQKENFVIYPNPNTGIFTVESKTTQQITRIMILRIATGQKVFEGSFKQLTVPIDISKEATGLYHVQVFFEDQSVDLKTISKK